MAILIGCEKRYWKILFYGENKRNNGSTVSFDVYWVVIDLTESEYDYKSNS